MSKYKWINATLFLLGLFGFITIAASASNRLACEGQLASLYNVEPTEAQEIHGEKMIGQTFTARHDNLNRVDIRFRDYHRENSQDVIFRLLEVPANDANPFLGQEKAKITFNAAEVTDQAWYRISFPPIPNSAQKTYFFVLQSPDSSPGDAITVSGIQRNIYQDGTAYLNDTPVPADLAFLACHKLPPLHKLTVLLEQISQNRPGIWGAGGFYLLLFLVYGLLLIIFFWQLSRHLSKGRGF